MHNFKYFITIFFLFLHSIPFSQSIQELQKLRKEYEKFQKEQTDIQLLRDFENSNESRISLPQKAQIGLQNSIQLDSLESKNKYFGYDFFSRRDTVSFWENLPTPSNYVLGPGDELIVSIWGETQLRETYIISKEGKIYDEKVGLLFLSGKNIKQAKDYLIQNFGKIYATLLGASPTSYIDISLGQLKSINVNFVGEVNFPGLYSVHPFSSVILGLMQAGGVDTTGSLRDIKIKREADDNIYSFDMYEYLLNGKSGDFLQLRDGDIVIVPIRKSTIQIDSLVHRPGIYESKEGESIWDLINYAGGVKSYASSQIGLHRIKPFEDRKNSEPIFSNYYLDYNKSKSVAAQDGDKILITSVFNSIHEVEIIGKVKKPGKYYFSRGMRIKDLLMLGGGFTDSTFTKSIYMKRAELIRKDPNSPYVKIIEINLNDVINEKNNSNLILQNQDRFVVHENKNFNEKENVQILGEVKIPGSYPLISYGETLKSLINRAGGFTENALNEGINIYRSRRYYEIEELNMESATFPENIISTQQKNNIQITPNNFTDEDQSLDWIKVAWQNDKVKLMPGDSVIIKEKTGTINVQGQVYNPGLIEYQPGKSINYYIDSAGGVTNLGDKRNTIVIYANGVIVPKKLLNLPKIRDGATIVVNQKIIQEPMDISESLTSILSIISTTYTILVLSNQVQ